MIEQLIEAGRILVAEKMVKGWAGNLSGRYQDKLIITRSGADLGILRDSDFAIVDPTLPTMELQALNPKPSSELAMHLATYKERPETQVILHVHPPQAIALGILGRSLPALTPDFYLHLGASVSLLPYMTPTTEEIGTAVGQLLRHAPALLLQNHGVLVVGQSVSQALLRLSLLEEQAGIYLAALAVTEPRTLSANDMQKLDEVTGGRYRRK